jgi:hypothetical protein
MRRQDISTRCIDNHETIMAMNGKERATPALFINGRPVGDVQTMDFAGDDSEATSMADEFATMKQSVFKFSGAIVDLDLDLLKMFLGVRSLSRRRVRRRRSVPIKRDSSKRRKQRLTRLQRRRKRQVKRMS